MLKMMVVIEIFSDRKFAANGATFAIACNSKQIASVPHVQITVSSMMLRVRNV